jgi:hypothetical protein
LTDTSAVPAAPLLDDEFRACSKLAIRTRLTAAPADCQPPRTSNDALRSIFSVCDFVSSKDGGCNGEPEKSWESIWR